MASKNIIAVTSILTVTIMALSFRFTDPQLYKNLQALPKDISRSGMDSTMDHFCNSLKVTCGYCHVKDINTNDWDHASDVKSEKLMARDMIRMTDSINQKFFKPEQPGFKNIVIQRVSCYSCHHGEHLPISIPPVPQKKSPWELGK